MKKRTKHLLQRVRHRLIKRSPNQIISEILFRAISTLDGKIISTESLLEESSNALKNILSYNKQVSDSFADKTSSLESRLNSITRWFLLSGSIKCCWVFISGWTASLNAKKSISNCGKRHRQKLKVAATVLYPINRNNPQVLMNLKTYTQMFTISCNS